jgi:hypothetical protein
MSSASFSSGVSVSESVDLPINRLKKLNMVCSGGVARFIDAVATALLRRTSEQRKRNGRWLPCREKPPKTAGEPGVCAKKAKDRYFISRHRL